jgi:hypothetical protein
LSEKIDPTWLAYSLEQPASPERLDAATRRLESHYATIVDYPLVTKSRLGERIGIVSLGDAEPVVRWPAFVESGDLAAAFAYPVSGWRRALGEGATLESAPSDLARALAREPDLAARRLPAPLVAGVVEAAAERLTIVNDFLGAGRLFEHRFDGGVVWSNRAAAPFIFRGKRPRASERGWRILAAASWWVGRSTAFSDLEKVEPGTVIEAQSGRVRHRQTHALGPLVETHLRKRLGEKAERAAEVMVSQVEDADRLWPGRLSVDLSGGRDSRTVAAAVVRAGLDARFVTSDVTPGEAAVAREVVAASPTPMEHRVRKEESDSELEPHSTPIRRRALNAHLLHDSMRHPQKLRGKMALPRSRPDRALLSGHGGDVAHGWLYRSRKDLLRLRLGGDDALSGRIHRLFAKDHAVASREGYELAAIEVDRTLDEARGYGVKPPVVLEYFYLLDRFVNRTGIAAHAERVSAFATQDFVEAAFAQRPAQRVDSKLHTLLVSTLVPEWGDIPFFKKQKSRMNKVRRLRLWQAPDDAAEVEALLSAGGEWTGLYDPDRARKAWARIAEGTGRSSWEAVFEGIVYRQAFEDYLDLLGSVAAQGAPLVDPA